MKNKSLTLVGFLVLGALLVPPGQRSFGAQSACSLLDRSHRAQYLSYESASDSDVRLRLHNNASCPIIVETADDAPLHAGAGKALALHYLVRHGRKQTAVPAYGWGDSVSELEIAPNDSITFFVPLSRLKAHDDVVVPFIYSWEGHNVGAGFSGGVQHLVYFLWDDLPTRRN